MKVKNESEVAQSCPTLSDPMDCSLPGSSVHGIFQARVLSPKKMFTILNTQKEGLYLDILHLLTQLYNIYAQTSLSIGVTHKTMSLKLLE